MKIRESNYELMRIISMLFIITGHVFSWGGVFNNSTFRIAVIINFIYAIIMVHVNSFVLVSGYFQSKSKFKISKPIHLLIMMWFYKALITIIGYKLGWFDFSSFDLLWKISPFDFSNYWFIKMYIVLYCLSPFINKMVSKLDRQKFRKLLIVMFFLCSILVSITNQELFQNSKGYSLVNFVFLYLVGYYIRAYVFSDERIKNYKNDKIKKIVALFLFFSIFVFAFLINYCLFRVGNKLTMYGGGYGFIGSRMVNVFMAYDNPLVIIGSVAYFMFFGFLNIKSKLINFISKFTLEIYIIHETAIFRPILYSLFGLNGVFNSYTIFLKVAVIVVFIFIGCSLISGVRMLIFKFIKFILNKFNFIQKITLKIERVENKIDNWMNC